MQVGFAAMSHMAQQNPNNMAQQNSHNMTHKYTLHSSNNYLDDQLLEELSTDPMLF